MSSKRSGWFGESRRHSLASRGIKTGQHQTPKTPKKNVHYRAIEEEETEIQFKRDFADTDTEEERHSEAYEIEMEGRREAESDLNENKTTVIFRKYPDGDIIALFPEDPADPDRYTIMSYMHIGQSGGANYNVVMGQTVPAEPSEYKELLEELVSMDYFGPDELSIRKRASHEAMSNAHEAMRRNMRR